MNAPLFMCAFFILLSLIKNYKMKIVIFTDTYSPEANGVVTSIEGFTKHLSGKGHQFLIFCPRYSKLKESNTNRNINVVRMKSISFLNNKEVKISLPLVFQVLDKVRSFAPDLIHVQTPLSIGWTGIIVSKLLNIKNIQTYHTYIPDFLIYLKPKTFFRSQNIAALINNTKIMKKFLEKDINFDSTKQELVRDYIYKRVAKLSDGLSRDKSGKISEVFAKNFTKTIYNRADLILTPTHTLKRILEKQKILKPITVQSNGVEMGMFLKKDSYKKTNRFIYAGRLGYEKNINIVIKALAIANKKNSFKLDIWGSGPAKSSLISFSKALNISNSVNFLGKYQRQDLAANMYKYDAFVSASTIETQGIVFLEAMASGLPILAADELAAPELVATGVNGYLFESFNERELAVNMLKIADLQSEKLQQMGRRSIEFANKHELVKCTDRLENIYKSLVS
jgi:1,2-diacylglycerol 3-alpha-glucosyltransferase